MACFGWRRQWRFFPKTLAKVVIAVIAWLRETRAA
jgi:hypothetical protein